MSFSGKKKCACDYNDLIQPMSGLKSMILFSRFQVARAILPDGAQRGAEDQISRAVFCPRSQYPVSPTAHSGETHTHTVHFT